MPNVYEQQTQAQALRNQEAKGILEARKNETAAAKAIREDRENAAKLQQARDEYALYTRPTYAQQAIDTGHYVAPYQALAEQARGTAAPTRTYGQTADTTNALATARQAAYGWQPSAAELQLRQGQQMALGNAQSLAASARGGQAQRVGIQRAALDQAGNQMQQLGLQAAQLRAAEMAQARQAYLQGALGEQGMAEAAAAQNLQAQQAQRALNLQASLGYEGIGQGIITQGMQQANNAAQLYSQRQIAEMQNAAVVQAQNADRAFQAQQAANAATKSLWSTVGGGLGAAVGGAGGFFIGGPLGAAGGAQAGYGLGAGLGGNMVGNNQSYTPMQRTALGG